MLGITVQVNLHIAVHACQHCMGDTFWSHNQNKGHLFEDNEKKATIVAQSKQSDKFQTFPFIFGLLFQDSCTIFLL